jgi:hypothetical protein
MGAKDSSPRVGQTIILLELALGGEYLPVSERSVRLLLNVCKQS